VAQDPEVEQRFKHELLLASKISHKNILRIHDLGESKGIKFISMAYVEGEDLHQILRRDGKLSLERTIHIAKQLCAALQAAHNEGVVHRDFKPHNILMDGRDNAFVSDFGIAKSLESDSGMTRAGEIMGTPRYMAPEQVEGKKVDHRVDLYALGLILYEMVTRDIPFTAPTSLQTMYKRVYELPASPKTINPDLPDWLTGIILKCLERDPDQRYQNASEILRDLEAGTAPAVAAASTSVEIAIPSVKMKLSRIALGIAAIVFLLAALLAVPPIRRRIFGGGAAPQTAHQPVTVLISDFSNRTDNPVLDGTFEPVFQLALEGASFITTYNRGDAKKLARKMTNKADKLDEATAQRVAVNQGIGVVVGGIVDRKGNGYVMSARAIQAVTGKTIATIELSAAGTDKLLSAAANAAQAIREGLGDDTSDSSHRFATETLTAVSLEAIHEYAMGIEGLTDGKFDESRRNFSKAVDLDPNFGLAYTALASVSRNLGQRQDAEKYAKLAIAHIDSMTERERYRTRGFYYLLNDNQQKCVEEYSALITRYPFDVAARNNRALCLVDSRSIPQAVEDMQQAVQILPKRPLYKANLSLYSTFSGDFQRAEREALALIQLDSSFAPGYVALAYAQLGQGKLAEAADTYQKLSKVSAFGASLAASGLADVALYQGRFADAVKILEEGAGGDLTAGNPDRAADKFAALAHAQLVRGDKKSALKSAQSVLANSKAANHKFLAARLFVDLGENGKARELASELSSELQAERQVYGKLIESEIALKGGDAKKAIALATEANKQLDTWIGRFDLGRAYLEAGAFTEADSEFDRCLKRRGEAVSLFLSLVPTYGNFPPVYYYQGRVREGVKSPGFAESYKAYLDIRGKAGEDSLIPQLTRLVSQ
jgi:eukaryotic-like serine/threonine-protein kinase